MRGALLYKQITTEEPFLNGTKQSKTASFIVSSGPLAQQTQRSNWQGFEAHTTQVSVRIPTVAATPEQEENGEGRSLRRGSVKLTKDLHPQRSFYKCKGGFEAGLWITGVSMDCILR